MSEIKPVLRQMIDNNKPHWRTATIRGAHKMLDEYEAKAKAFDEIKNNLHDAQSSIDRSGNRKEERDHAVAFFNGLVEMDILEVYERTERND